MPHLTVSQSDGTPIYAQLLHQIKALIATGRLKPDEEIPQSGNWRKNWCSTQIQ
jgi:DNA-binding transcriptional regulator YhcF (GntR family)